ncbi:MAG: helix-turn-helix domain-containing protein [Candidatus Sumerlaeia bacterium]|nr:helix-turn-helix domain-containing protein [Candidatus Sumerlaeia bacterium]
MAYSYTAKHKILSVTSELMRVDRVARILDVTKKRVYNLIAEGKLEAVKLGPRQTRITRESLESYINRLLAHSRYERGIVEDETE